MSDFNMIADGIVENRFRITQPQQKNLLRKKSEQMNKNDLCFMISFTTQIENFHSTHSFHQRIVHRPNNMIFPLWFSNFHLTLSFCSSAFALLQKCFGIVFTSPSPLWSGIGLFLVVNDDNWCNMRCIIIKHVPGHQTNEKKKTAAKNKSQ